MSYYGESGDARDVGWYDALDQAVRFELVRRLVQPGDVVVDVGCGSGELAIYLSQNGCEFEYVGVECHSPFVEIARGRGFEVISANYMDGFEERGDVVVALGSLVGNGGQNVHDVLLSRLRDSTRRDWVAICGTATSASLMAEPEFIPAPDGRSFGRFERIDSNRTELPTYGECLERVVELSDEVDPNSLARAYYVAENAAALERVLRNCDSEFQSLMRARLQVDVSS